MFASSIPLDKKPINLSLHEKFEDKLLTVYDYAKIQNIYIEVSNPEDINNQHPVDLKVTQLVVPPGSASYMNSKLKECFTILSDEANIFIQGEDDFESIGDSLKRCVEKADHGFEVNNLYDTFTFDQNLTILIYKDEKWKQTLFQYLKIPPDIYEVLKEHFDVRRGFFDKMSKTILKALQFHQFQPGPHKKPYTLDSTNPELDVSEILFTLYRISKQLRIDFDAGGSFPKFKRAFFELFGLSDKNYDRKIREIRKRKLGGDFLRDLADKLEESRDMPKYEN